MRITRLTFLAAACLTVATSAAHAASINGFAAMGASETAGTDVTGSWVPYVVNQRGLNFGGAGNPFNVAIGGATSATLLTQGQHTQVQTFVQNGDVDLAFLSI